MTRAGSNRQQRGRILAWLPLWLALASAGAGGQEAPPARLDVEQFVARTYFHGIPYDEVLAYGPADVPALLGVLQDPAREAHWANAAVMLAMIGDPRGVAAVLEFIRNPGAGEPTAHRDWIRGNALMALGYAAHGGRSRQALQYLEESLQPGAWKRRGVRGARADAPTDQPALGEEEDDAGVEGSLTRFAAAGLALSGGPEARRALLAYRDRPERSANARARIDSLLTEHQVIAGKGVALYDRERIERVKGLRPAARPRGVADEGAPEEGGAAPPAAEPPPPPDAADPGAGGG